MAIIIGSEAKDRSDHVGTNTLIVKEHPANASGKITS
ncbi:unnamed protein product, partial [marine sediment metagenome]